MFNKIPQQLIGIYHSILSKYKNIFYVLQQIFLTIVKIFSGSCLLLFLSFVPLFAAALLSEEGDRFGVRLLSSVLVFVYFLVVIFVYLFYCSMAKDKYVIFTSPTRSILMFLGGVAVGLLISGMLSVLYFWVNEDTIVFSGRRLTEFIPCSIMLACLWELLIRGVVLSALLNYFNIHFCVISVSVVFGLYARNHGGNFFYEVGLLGLIGGYIFVYFKSIWPGLGLQSTLSVFPGTIFPANLVRAEDISSFFSSFYFVLFISRVLFVVFKSPMFRWLFDNESIQDASSGKGRPG